MVLAKPITGKASGKSSQVTRQQYSILQVKFL